ncbi:MAG: deoxynucleoside kinase [Gammaproteobacteria bacterium]
MSSKPLRYIVFEGPIGVGKTSLARRVASALEYELVLEQAEENPFLERFYRDPVNAALPTQLHFLFQRARQIQELRQNDLFTPSRVADFLLDKDRLFAQLTLADEEYSLYEQVYQQLSLDAPVPDLVVYLQAPADVLLQRVRQRGIDYEQRITPDYLQRLADAYLQFFHRYDRSPLLIVNAAAIDPVHNTADFQQMLDRILNVTSGRHYFNPVPFVPASGAR